MRPGYHVAGSSMTLSSIGKTALKIYACHILAFTIGASLGAIEAFGILCVMWGPCS